MNRSGTDWRLPVLLVSLITIALLATAAILLLFPSSTDADATWEGFYTLVLQRTDDTAPVETALTEAGFAEVLSRRTVMVSISDFNGLERLPLAALDDRLAPMDPRRDPFLQKAPRLFEAGRAGEWEVIYLRSAESTAAVRSRVRTALSGLDAVDGWELAESHSPRRLLYLIGFAALMPAAVLLSGRPRWPAAVGALPWAASAVSGGSGTFVAAALIYFAWLMTADTGRRYLDHRLQYGESSAARRELRYSLLVLAATWALVLGFNPAATLRGLAPVLLASVGAAAFSAAIVVGAVFRRRRQDHRLFVPVSIRPAPPTVSAASRFGPTAAAVAVLVVTVPYIAAFLPQSRVPATPRPTPLAGHESIDFAALHVLERGGGAGPVTIADYIAHRAYQEGFVYGAEYGLPDEDEALTLTRVREEDGRTVQVRDVVLRYDEAWLKAALGGSGDVRPGGFAALLANGNRPSGVVRSPEPGVYSPSTHPARYSLQALLAFLPFLVVSIRVLRAARSRAPAPMLGRKRQAA